MSDFKHGYIGCFDAPVPTVFTFFCHCFSYGNYMNRMDDNNNIWLCCLLDMFLPCCAGLKGRVDARKKYVLLGNAGALDLAYGFCCPLCSHCQVLQEVNERESPQGPLPEFFQVAPEAGASMGDQFKTAGKSIKEKK
eukprot:TRINITY_DN46101_c0_g1_i1.p1 TRINITY_DN46101_c0_g1~~TRINITY_DN46101_c0_g1_i1.p1  ORF type:complete len:148 (-),score=42.21 TRINITY_DN46101_c0_g1_i1:93-503(-)